MRFETTNNEKIVGYATKVVGKKTTLRTWKTQYRGTISRVSIIGRNDLTMAERARNEFILRVLRGETALSSPMILALFFNQQFPTSAPLIVQNTIPNQFKTLNPSQQKVLRSMMTLADPITVVHGPPGTGKTMVIAAAIGCWSTADHPVWTVAQSNVGVKNIALSLMKQGVDFKLIVSKEFHCEWSVLR